MTKLLIYRDRADFFNDEATVHKLRDTFAESDYCSRDLPLLTQKISRSKVQALLIFTAAGISPELEEVLAKNKNHINLHDSLVIVVHSKLDEAEAQRSLMLGADHVLTNPLNVEFLLRVLTKHFHHENLESRPAYEHFPFPINCRIDTFGRIGRIDKHPPWDFYVESSLELKTGDQLELHHLLAVELGRKGLRYEVASRTTRGLYYRYAYQYRLKWLADEELQQAFRTWSQDHQSEFSVPKVKVLFVLGEARAPLIHDFSSPLFSPYLLFPSQLDEEILKRMDPQILVRENLSEPLEKLILEWSLFKSGNAESLLLLKEDGSVAPEDSELYGELFFQQAEPFVRENFQSRNESFSYLSRKSPYSRFSAPTDARIWAISAHHILLESERNFSKGAVLQLHIAHAGATDGLALLKVDATGEATQNGWKISCTICHLAASERESIFKARSCRPAVEKVQEAAPVGRELPGVSRRKLLVRLSVAILAAVVVLLFVSFYYNRSRQPLVTDPSATPYDAFQKSVKKAFGGGP